jgi:hypothetical protein
MVSQRWVFCVVIALALVPRVSASHDLSADQKGAVSAWLGKHPGYRLANDKDCACDDDLRTIRSTGYGGKWKHIPDYHPYVANGDFNGDGQIDFAVAVIRTNGTRKFTILVFNGPIKSPDDSPSFVDSDSNLRGIGFFYGPPRPKPYRLVVGAFESEGYVLVPKGQTYRFQPISSENE